MDKEKASEEALMMYPANQLGEQVRDYDETEGVAALLKSEFFDGKTQTETLHRGLNKYHFVPEYEGSERNAPQASLVTSVIIPVALVAVVIVALCDVLAHSGLMVLVRLFT